MNDLVRQAVGYAFTPEQHEERRNFIGASEAAAICGVSSYATPVDVWLEKTGQMPPRESDNEDAYWGKRLEGIVIDEYRERREANITARQRVFYHDQYPFIRATVDAIAIPESGGPRVLQAKTARHAKEWGPPDTDVLPVQYVFQVQHEMACTGFLEADVAVLIAGRDFRIYTVPRDQKIIDAMLAVEVEFWRCVQERRPPPIRTPDDGRALYPTDKEDVIEATEEIYDAYRGLRACKTAIKIGTANMESEQTKIMAFMKDAGRLTFQGETLATWRQTKPGHRTDLDKLKAQYPLAYADCTVETAGTRPFKSKEEIE